MTNNHQPFDGSNARRGGTKPSGRLFRTGSNRFISLKLLLQYLLGMFDSWRKAREDRRTSNYGRGTGEFTRKRPQGGHGRRP